MNERDHEVQTRPRTFSKEEKAALILLIVAGIGGLFFGMKYMGKNLQAPFAFTYDGEQFLTSDQAKDAEAEAMKSRDTDNDGLSDYDEAYIYKTSAYLIDSDSDGRNDAEEVLSGEDPNCPVGKECIQVTETQDSTVTNLLGGSTSEPTFDFGAAQDLLDSVSGTTDTGTTEIEGSTSSTTDAELYSQLSNLTPDEVRQLLISNGAAEADLDGVSDEELMTMFQEVLTQYQSGSL